MDTVILMALFFSSLGVAGYLSVNADAKKWRRLHSNGNEGTSWGALHRLGKDIEDKK